jgi:hypothetical protein
VHEGNSVKRILNLKGHNMWRNYVTVSFTIYLLCLLLLRAQLKKVTGPLVKAEMVNGKANIHEHKIFPYVLVFWVTTP